MVRSSWTFLIVVVEVGRWPSWIAVGLEVVLRSCLVVFCLFLFFRGSLLGS